jgi:hypothetical protein
MADLIVNKVASSGLITIDLEKYLPAEILSFDLKDHLFMGLILKEKDFREALKNYDWSVYQDKYVTIFCSADAIIPLWAYMLVTASLQPVAKDIYTGSVEEMYKHLVLKNISAIDSSEFKGQRIVIKGCGDKEIENYAYTEVTKLLRPVARSIMYGEPCSTVPVYKSKE